MSHGIKYEDMSSSEKAAIAAGQGQWQCSSRTVLRYVWFYPGDEMHPVFECAALQMLRDDMPTRFQGVRNMWCFVWQDNMVLVSSFVRDAVRMVRAASSGNELDVYSAKLAGIDVIIFYLQQTISSQNASTRLHLKRGFRRVVLYVDIAPQPLKANGCCVFASCSVTLAGAPVTLLSCLVLYG